MTFESELISLVRHGMSCVTTVACVYLIGRAALPVVVRVLEFLDNREEEENDDEPVPVRAPVQAPVFGPPPVPPADPQSPYRG